LKEVGSWVGGWVGGWWWWRWWWWDEVGGGVGGRREEMGEAGRRAGCEGAIEPTIGGTEDPIDAAFQHVLSIKMRTIPVRGGASVEECKFFVAPKRVQKTELRV
jgi:hypothetical protein